MAPLLEIRHLRTAFPGPRGRGADGRIHVVDDVSFGLERGEVLALVGESGSGKSMTALALMGLLPEGARTGGRMAFEGRDLLTLDEDGWRALRGNRIAMTFQEPMTALNPVQPIGQQVIEPILLHRNVTRAEAEHEAVRLLDRVGLPEPRRRLAS